MQWGYGYPNRRLPVLCSLRILVHSGLHSRSRHREHDHNPPRIAPRNLFDVTLGKNNIFHADHYKTDLDLTAINVTNKYALYNFLSTFSGTHYVTPRAMTAKVTVNF